MNKTPQILSPFHGKPRTKQHLDQAGRLSFSLSPRELTPFRAKTADNLGTLSAIGAIYEGFQYVQALFLPPDWIYWAAIGGPILALPLLKRTYRWLFKKRSLMVITPTEFKFLTWRGWKIYDRRLPHKFALLAHDKAQLEKEQIEKQMRLNNGTGNTYSQRCIYGDSWIISFEYLGQRNDIATIFGQKEAIALVSRLKACDEVMDAQAKMGDGTALNPDDQWDDQPGDIED